MPAQFVCLHVVLTAASVFAVYLCRDNRIRQVCLAFLMPGIWLLGMASERVPWLMSIAMRGDCPDSMRQKMISYGWEPGEHHAVVLLGIESDGKWMSVADPSSGRERWPVSDLTYIWDGFAMSLVSDL